MDRATIINIVKKFKEEIQSSFKPKEVYLYGSHARGTADKNSDIDVALVYDKYDSDTYLEDLSKLWKLSHKIDLRIEPVIVDNLDDISGFLSEIKNNGILID